MSESGQQETLTEHHHNFADGLRGCLELVEGVVIFHPETLSKFQDTVKVVFSLAVSR